MHLEGYPSVVHGQKRRAKGRKGTKKAEKCAGTGKGPKGDKKAIKRYG